jgi:hypothetical protein
VSKRVPVLLGDRGFWAYQQSLSVVLLQAVEAIETGDAPEWLVGEMSNWRRSAGLPDHALRFPDDWSREQRDLTVSYLARVRSRMLTEPLLPAEMNRLRPFDDLDPMFRWSGSEPVASDRFIEVADGMIQLLDDTLPVLEQAWWYLGTRRRPPLKTPMTNY